MLNATAALSTACACNAPVLCITGQIPSPYIGGGLGFLHEIPDQARMLASVSKWQGRITSPTHTPVFDDWVKKPSADSKRNIDARPKSLPTARLNETGLATGPAAVAGPR